MAENYRSPGKPNMSPARDSQSSPTAPARRSIDARQRAAAVHLAAKTAGQIQWLYNQTIALKSCWTRAFSGYNS
jgi:hypothetical protein